MIGMIIGILFHGVSEVFLQDAPYLCLYKGFVSDQFAVKVL